MAYANRHAEISTKLTKPGAVQQGRIHSGPAVTRSHNDGAMVPAVASHTLGNDNDGDENGAVTGKD